MQKLPVTQLNPGMLVPYDLFNDKGELLVTRGVTLSQQHIDLLRRRNIFDVFFLEPIIEDHTDTDHSNDEPPIAQPASCDISSFVIPERFSPEYEKLRKLHLEKLIRSSLTVRIDRSLKSGRVLGRPIGVSIRGSLKQIFPGQRSDDYKQSVGGLYFDMLENVRDVFYTLLSGQRIELNPLKRLVDQLITIYIDDPSMILSLAGLKEEGDAYIFSHTLNVCILSITIAAAAGYSREQVNMIGLGALLHDTGMFLVPRDIWDKKAKLNKAELEQIQKHPVTGIHILDNIRNLPEPVQFIAYQSHERENGTGYPRQRKAGGIHGYAKIIQIADIFEALTSTRTYRQAYTPFEAIEVLIGMSQKAMISKPLLRALLSFTSLFPVGSIVELSDHRLARVVQANPEELDKPVVSIVAETDRGVLDSSAVYFCNLAAENGLHIIRALSPYHMRPGDVLSGF